MAGLELPRQQRVDDEVHPPSEARVVARRALHAFPHEPGTFGDTLRHAVLGVGAKLEALAAAVERPSCDEADCSRRIPLAAGVSPQPVADVTDAVVSVDP